MTDHQIIQSCLKGDSRAERQLFDRYYRYVYTIALRYLTHHHDAEDAVSEAFIRIYRSLSQVVNAESSGVKRWIQRIAINESLRLIKRRRSIVFVEDTTTITDFAETEDLPSSDIPSGKIMEAINSLADGYRIVFLLSAVDGLSHTEIADFLNVSRNTSKSQMRKARAQLQHKLRHYESRAIR